MKVGVIFYGGSWYRELKKNIWFKKLIFLKFNTFTLCLTQLMVNCTKQGKTTTINNNKNYIKKTKYKNTKSVLLGYLLSALDIP